MPPIVGALVSARLVTLTELQTVYGVVDAYDLLEVHNVDAYNEGKIRDAAARSK